MINVKKRDGTMQQFEKDKLRNSMVKAGAKDATARKVAETIAPRVREGMHTSDIKRQAASELRRIDQAAAERYESFKPEITAM